ncbi:MAG TPA: hypothetical protein VL051_16035 [Burkholderiaceae bacterium]|nr:hypothetical protein [Burkholderiaceae bacterium]
MMTVMAIFNERLVEFLGELMGKSSAATVLVKQHQEDCSRCGGDGSGAQNLIYTDGNTSRPAILHACAGGDALPESGMAAA